MNPNHLAFGIAALALSGRALTPIMEIEARSRRRVEQLATLTPAQTQVYQALMLSSEQGHDACFASAQQVDPEMTMEDLQAIAKQELIERSDTYSKAEAKRARKREKLLKLEERAGR